MPEDVNGAFNSDLSFLPSKKKLKVEKAFLKKSWEAISPDYQPDVFAKIAIMQASKGLLHTHTKPDRPKKGNVRKKKDVVRNQG